jgi:hypothetical protein
LQVVEQVVDLVLVAQVVTDMVALVQPLKMDMIPNQTRVAVEEDSILHRVAIQVAGMAVQELSLFDI